MWLRVASNVNFLLGVRQERQADERGGMGHSTKAGRLIPATLEVLQPAAVANQRSTKAGRLIPATRGTGGWRRPSRRPLNEGREVNPGDTAFALGGVKTTSYAQRRPGG